MFKNTILISLAVLPAVMGLPSDPVSRQSPPAEVSCDTSPNSPYVTDVQAALEILRNKGDINCVNNHNSPNACSELQRSGSAMMSMCGAEGQSISCRTATYDIQQILAFCVESGKVGGSYQTGGGDGANRVQIQKSPGH